MIMQNTRKQRTTVWFRRKEGGVGKERGVTKQKESRAILKPEVILNNTENDMDSHNIGQVAESETKRDNC